MSSTTPPFTLSRATPEDLHELVKIEYACFPPFVREAFMGCKSEADLPRLAKHYIEDAAKDPSAVWIKLVDNESQKIVAGSLWNVFPNAAPETSGEHPVPWLEGESKQKAERLMWSMNEKRTAANPNGYVRK